MTLKSLTTAASLLLTAPAITLARAPTTTDEARFQAGATRMAVEHVAPPRAPVIRTTTDGVRELAGAALPADAGTAPRNAGGVAPTTTDEARALAGAAVRGMSTTRARSTEQTVASTR